MNPNDRIALLGANGAGKSTLLGIIAGRIEPDSGSVGRARTASVGYLPQEGVYHRGRTLLEETWKAFEDILRLEERIADLAAQIEKLAEVTDSSSTELHALMDELGRAQHDMERREGYKKEAKIREILFGLGFSERDLSRRTEEFSGGWHMRIELAKLLLAEPSVLLLDEPTNHLDLESLEWIEDYLKSYEGSLLLVSHDSRFLDTLVNRVLEISRGKATEYAGNYSSYLQQKENRRRIAEAAHANRKKLVEHTSRFVERFRYKSTKSAQVQSRLKMLERLGPIVEIDEKERKIGFAFPDPPRSGRLVMELKRLGKRYGDKTVLDNLSLAVERGDRIACLGANGSGKSTLARIMAGIEPYQDGQCVPGHHVVIAYYSQDLAEQLHPDKTVLEILEERAPGRSPTELRNLLGSFLFSGDDAFKPVSVLSGGEKSRLALAKMLLEPANFLILDEPTNHLDASSKEVLQQRLRDFRGTCFIVSHDRDFLAPLANRVVVLGDKGFDLFGGTLDEYLERIHRLKEETASPAGEVAKKRGTHSPNRLKKREEARARQEKHRKIKPLRSARESVEAAIEEKESRLGKIEEAFTRRETFGDERLLESLRKEHAQLKDDLDPLYEKWEEHQEAIERIEKEYAPF